LKPVIDALRRSVAVRDVEINLINNGSLYAVVEDLRRRGHIVTAETMRQGNRPERTEVPPLPASAGRGYDQRN
jgi:hypothetical protein